MSQKSYDLLVQQWREMQFDAVQEMDRRVQALERDNAVTKVKLAFVMAGCSAAGAVLGSGTTLLITHLLK